MIKKITFIINIMIIIIIIIQCASDLGMWQLEDNLSLIFQLKTENNA